MHSVWRNLMLMKGLKLSSWDKRLFNDPNSICGTLACSCEKDWGRNPHGWPIEPIESMEGDRVELTVILFQWTPSSRNNLRFRTMALLNIIWKFVRRPKQIFVDLHSGMSIYENVLLRKSNLVGGFKKLFSTMVHNYMNNHITIWSERSLDGSIELAKSGSSRVRKIMKIFYSSSLNDRLSLIAATLGRFGIESRFCGMDNKLVNLSTSILNSLSSSYIIYIYAMIHVPLDISWENVPHSIKKCSAVSQSMGG